MPLKDILVHLDASGRSAARLDIAIALAQRHGAHLTGLYVLDVPVPTSVVPDAGGAGVAMLYEQLRTSGLQGAAEIERRFDDRLRREGIIGTWRLVEGLTADQVARHGRYADLVILGQDDPDAGSRVLEAAIFATGRPVLAIPFAGEFPAIGRRVLVGWNESREATRAVHDAMPLLIAAEAVTVLAVNPPEGLDGDSEGPAADLARHLARHGVKATAEHVVAPEVPDGEALLNAAAEAGADLLVVGAYGHSRLRELVMGGVSRTLLRSMTLPVLLSH
ncbi:universal stress protein [Crenalkalicoccus roseus]|uniref:universal stress protein n=1 Tax=Crenalkalicoccus roseus TaxID=1485588 RepID=UPI001081EAF6|nr:universal stress protein [Crenalkalicoccus roseus]